MKSISFFVDGDPKGQPRPRAFARRMGNKFVARVYDSSTAEGWKSLIAQVAQPYRGEPLAGPVRLKLTFIIRRPKKHFRSNKLEKGLRLDAPFYHTAKPDNDNLQKAVMDALTQLGGFWKDDAQVAIVDSSKVYGQQTGCHIIIEEAA